MTCGLSREKQNPWVPQAVFWAPEHLAQDLHTTTEAFAYVVLFEFWMIGEEIHFDRMPKLTAFRQFCRMAHMMISDDNLDLGDFGDLGWGIRSIGRGIKKGAKGVAKGAVKGTKAVVTNKYVKTAAKVAMPLTYVAAKVSKAAFNLAVKPIRWQLNKLKGGRANVVAARAGRGTPNAADQAQARKDTKALLSKKGPHGKMLAYLADGPSFAGELGAAGVDDAALIAAAGALTALAKKLVTDAARAGFTAATTAAAKKISPKATAAVQTVARATQTAEQAATQAQQTAAQAAQVEQEVEQVTPEEVQQEVATTVEETAQEAGDEALEGAGFFGLAEETRALIANPAAMPPVIASRVASATQSLMCNLSPSDLITIGGESAARIGAALCDARKRGDAVRVRALMPQAVQIAAMGAKRLSDEIATAAYASPNASEFGFAPRAWRNLQERKRLIGKKAKRRTAFYGVSPAEVTLLAALNGASSDDLAYGLAGADAVGAKPAVVTALAMLPALAAVGAGIWAMTRG